MSKINIIQTWKTTAIPATCYPFVMKIRELNKNYNHTIFTDNDIINFITNKFQ